MLDFKQGEDFYYLKIKAMLADKSELHIREYLTESDYLYSYHWQDANGKLIIRWDNSPLHHHIRTFTHHKHTIELEESYEVDFEDVIQGVEGTVSVGGTVVQSVMRRSRYDSRWDLREK